MIHVTRLDGSDVVVNADLIALVEHTPDTMLTLVTGTRILVREPVEEVVSRTIGYRQEVFRSRPFVRDIAEPPAGKE